MRELGVLQLHAATLSATAAGADVDLKDTIHVGRREVMAILTAIPSGADTDETLAYKLQESATTVDSDFSDITGGAFTSITQESTAAVEKIFCNVAKRYVRAYATLGGTTPSFALASHLVVVNRAYPDT